MSVAGRVVQVWRHPVKSLQGERLEGALVRARGVVGDRRFRPNLVVVTDLDLEELAGTRVSVGDVTVEIGARTRRCAMTTAGQPGLRKDVGVLRALAADSGLCLGVYARVVSPGTVREGDTFVA